MSKLKVLFVPTNVSGVVFYRAWQPFKALKWVSGVQPSIWWFSPKQFTLHPWEAQIHDPQIGPSIVRDLDLGCKWADVVIWMGLHTYQSLNLFRQLKARHSKIFISEFDDYLFSIPEKNAAYEFYKPGEELTRVGVDQLKESDGVIVSTSYLKELYLPFNNNIQVVENVVDLALWRCGPPSPVRQRVTIGWVGGGTHEQDLAIIKDPLFKVLEENENVSFTCMHGIPSFFRGHKKIRTVKAFKPTNKYPKWVIDERFDIGLAPLVDNNFNRGKSNLRWLEYSAMKVPCIASPLPHFVDAIIDGKTGFLAKNTEDWVKLMTLLITNRDLRLQVGRSAFEEVRENWSMKTLGRKYFTAIKGILNAGSHEGRFGGTDSGSTERSERLTVV